MIPATKTIFVLVAAGAGGVVAGVYRSSIFYIFFFNIVVYYYHRHHIVHCSSSTSSSTLAAFQLSRYQNHQQLVCVGRQRRRVQVQDQQYHQEEDQEREQDYFLTEEQEQKERASTVTTTSTPFRPVGGGRTRNHKFRSYSRHHSHYCSGQVGQLLLNHHHHHPHQFHHHHHLRMDSKQKNSMVLNFDRRSEQVDDDRQDVVDDVDDTTTDDQDSSASAHVAQHDASISNLMKAEDENDVVRHGGNENNNNNDREINNTLKRQLSMPTPQRYDTQTSEEEGNIIDKDKYETKDIEAGSFKNYFDENEMVANDNDGRIPMNGQHHRQLRSKHHKPSPQLPPPSTSTSFPIVTSSSSSMLSSSTSLALHSTSSAVLSSSSSSSLLPGRNIINNDNGIIDVDDDDENIKDKFILNLNLSTKDNYGVTHKKFYGPYKHIRASLDYEYHGNYSKSRQELQDAIVHKLLDGTMIHDTTNGRVCKTPTEPWIVFTAGVMGAGKSHTMKHLASQGLFPLQSYVVVDPDEIRSNFPEYHVYAKECPKVAGELTHTEAGYVTEIVTAAALQQGHNVLVDGSLRDYAWYRGYFKSLREEYGGLLRIAIVHITAPREVVFERAANRAKNTGRIVPIETLEKSLEQVPISVMKLAPLADFFCELDNSPCTSSGGEVTIRTPGITWDKFRDNWAQTCPWAPAEVGLQKMMGKM